ncbi:anti-sigma factor [Candidatus Chloroploca sp. Khr17]|uniref:anti-sigma factor family protein n=1 Tax=Candidatus Chloroploca sp. Khr17 TaxID=2496869 RepID=UPI00101BD4F6|nr:hypothetical protein [Candidatus Chloroploca sp. Khr17]
MNHASKANLSEHDELLLSAYLDQQLTVAERVNLERRLEREPPLKAELEALRATVASLRELETVVPPRSFTLDPATTVRPRFAWPLAWVMQFGSGLVGLLLVVFASVQLLGMGNQAMADTAMFEPMSAMIEQEAQASPEAGVGYAGGLETPEVASVPTEASARAAATPEARVDPVAPMAPMMAAEPAPEADALPNNEARSAEAQPAEGGRSPVAAQVLLGVGILLMGGAVGWYVVWRRRYG